MRKMYNLCIVPAMISLYTISVCCSDCVLYSGTNTVSVVTRTTDLDQQTTVMHTVMATQHRLVAVL